MVPSRPPLPPTSAEIAATTGHQIHSRSTLRSTPTSTVERIIASGHGTPRQPAVLKTTRPALAHESAAYALLDGLAIRAATLLGSGRTHAGAPWLLLSAVQGAPVGDADHAAVQSALQRMAAAHSRHFGAALPDLPRRDPRWLAARADWTCDALRRHAAVDGGLLAAYRQRLAALAAQAPDATTLAHGDFDPGNLLRLRDGGAAALDWGLSHLNTPLVDLAHMVERYGEPVRSRLAAHYLRGLEIDLKLSEDTAVALGGLIHRAFFIWWHVTIVDRGWAPAADYRQLLSERVQHIAADLP